MHCMEFHSVWQVENSKHRGVLRARAEVAWQVAGRRDLAMAAAVLTAPVWVPTGAIVAHVPAPSKYSSDFYSESTGVYHTMVIIRPR
jgi:hypothetical protein